MEKSWKRLSLTDHLRNSEILKQVQKDRTKKKPIILMIGFFIE